MAAGLAAALVACTGIRVLSKPPPATELGAPDPGVRVALLWNAPIDLDLYVTDPALETVYFANNPAKSGGQLANDVGCDQKQGPRVETIIWKAPPPGRYRVGVDFSQSCDGGTDEAPFRVAAEVRGERREKVGSAFLERFDPVVLEFEVPARKAVETEEP